MIETQSVSTMVGHTCRRYQHQLWQLVSFGSGPSGLVSDRAIVAAARADTTVLIYIYSEITHIRRSARTHTYSISTRILARRPASVPPHSQQFWFERLAGWAVAGVLGLAGACAMGLYIRIAMCIILRIFTTSCARAMCQPASQPAIQPNGRRYAIRCDRIHYGPLHTHMHLAD